MLTDWKLIVGSVSWYWPIGRKKRQRIAVGSCNRSISATITSAAFYPSSPTVILIFRLSFFFVFFVTSPAPPCWVCPNVRWISAIWVPASPSAHAQRRWLITNHNRSICNMLILDIHGNFISSSLLLCFDKETKGVFILELVGPTHCANMTGWRQGSNGCVHV